MREVLKALSVRERLAAGKLQKSGRDCDGAGSERIPNGQHPTSLFTAEQFFERTAGAVLVRSVKSEVIPDPEPTTRACGDAVTNMPLSDDRLIDSSEPDEFIQNSKTELRYALVQKLRVECDAHNHYLLAHGVVIEAENNKVAFVKSNVRLMELYLYYDDNDTHIIILTIPVPTDRRRRHPIFNCRTESELVSNIVPKLKIALDLYYVTYRKRTNLVLRCLAWIVRFNINCLERT